MPKTQCVDCSEWREVVRVRPKQTRCTDCSAKARRKPNKCIDCGCDRAVSSSTGRCSHCHHKFMQSTEQDRTRVCIDCGDTKIMDVASRAKSTRCSSCAAKERAKRIPMPKKTKKVMPPRIRVTTDTGRVKTMYMRVCTNPKCEDHAYVSQAPKDPTTVLCKSCIRKVGANRLTDKRKARVKPKDNTVSAEAINRAREINKEHKIAVDNQKKKAPKQTLSDEEMMSVWLKKNKPTVKIDTIPIDRVHLFSGGLGEGW